MLVEAVEFITEAISSGGKVLVHCLGGRSRSASCVIAYLMKTMGIDLDTALAMVRAKRSVANPNDSFITQLYAYH